MEGGGEGGRGRRREGGGGEGGVVGQGREGETERDMETKCPHTVLSYMSCTVHAGHPD